MKAGDIITAVPIAYQPFLTQIIASDVQECCELNERRRIICPEHAKPWVGDVPPLW